MPVSGYQPAAARGDAGLQNISRYFLKGVCKGHNLHIDRALTFRSCVALCLSALRPGTFFLDVPLDGTEPWK